MQKFYKKVGKRYVEIEPQRFSIDFFEFSFLVEACIPPTPIARAYFWGNVIDKYYYEMTPNERERLFNWINKDWRFQNSLEKGNEDCLLFNARFDKDNQFLVFYSFGGKEDTTEAFKFGEKYHVTKHTSVNKDYITKIEKIESKTDI